MSSTFLFIVKLYDIIFPDKGLLKSAKTLPPETLTTLTSILSKAKVIPGLGDIFC